VEIAKTRSAPANPVIAQPSYKLYLIFAFFLIVVTYLSLYPFQWRTHLPPTEPLAAFMARWRTWPESRGDFVANIAFYLPCGFSLIVCLSRRVPVLLRIGVTVLLCTALSVGLELCQFYIAHRVCDIRDTYANSIGSLLGASAALIFGIEQRVSLLAQARRNPFPAMLVAAFLAARLYPYVPVIDLHKYLRAIRPLFAFAVPAPDELFLRIACWMTVFFMLDHVFGRRRVLAIFIAIAACVFGGQIAIDNAELRVGELIGAIITLPLSLGLLKASWRPATVLAIVFTVAVVIERLQPFQFSSLSNGFGWIAFAALVHGSNEHSLITISEKVFLYGSLIWLWVEAGLSRSVATLGSATLLLMCSIAETHIPTRVAETTDAAIALLIGGAMVLLPSAPECSDIKPVSSSEFERLR
jgi:VanZ family protein